MPVTSTTILSVPVWQFSGVVTNAEIRGAWASLITNGIYSPGRAIYLAADCDLRSATGPFVIDFGAQVNPAIILDADRNRANCTFKNFFFLQSVGLQFSLRERFVMGLTGSTLTPLGNAGATDGLSAKGGGFIYAVEGSSGAADPRYMNKLGCDTLDNFSLMSQSFTEQDLIWFKGTSGVVSGLTLEKCSGFPQIDRSDVRVLVYDSTINAQHPSQTICRVYQGSAVCYVNSYITRNGLPTSTYRMIETTASAETIISIFTGWDDPRWFGDSNTTLGVTGWNASSRIVGGVLKKYAFVGGGNAAVRVYNSADTQPQSCRFLGTAVDSGNNSFLDPSASPTTDADGNIQVVFVCAIATGATGAVTRYTGQTLMMQKYGLRVMKISPSTSGGDTLSSAYAPILTTPQPYITRTLEQVFDDENLPVATLDDLMEEIHAWATTVSGPVSYNGAYDGNLFYTEGSALILPFSNLIIDPSFANKMEYDPVTDTLRVRCSSLSAGTHLDYLKLDGVVTTQNGGAIAVNYLDATGAVVSLTQDGGGVFSGMVRVNGVDSQPYHNVSSIPLRLVPTDVVRIYMIAYGRKGRIINTTGEALLQNATFALDADQHIDLTVNTTRRNEVAAALDYVSDGQGSIGAAVNANLVNYTPAEALAGFHWWLVSEGTIGFSAALEANTASLFTTDAGSVVLGSSNLYVQANDSFTSASVPASGLYVPLVIRSSVVGYNPLRKNVNGVVLGTALWTQETAAMAAADRAAVAQQTAADVWSATTRTLTTPAGATLAQIEASPVLAKEATVAAMAASNQDEHDATQAAISALPAAPSASTVAASVRQEIRPDLDVINDGVKNASLLIPHGADLA